MKNSFNKKVNSGGNTLLISKDCITTDDKVILGQTGVGMSFSSKLSTIKKLLRK